MPTTYTPLATTTLTSPSATVVFNSIPQIYTDLILVTTARQATVNTTDMGLQINGNGAITASWTSMNGNGSSATSTRSSNPFGYFYLGDSAPSNASSGIFSVVTTHINNYSNTTTFKTVISRSSQDLAGSGNVRAAVGLFPTTSAITSLTIGGSAGSNFATGSTFSLYGVASAAVVAQGAKATGGDVVATDGTYWYHAFRASGTFTPTEALTADVLVVAGGGGSGGSQGSDKGSGGGGAGGVIYFASQSLSATGYSVTVGAGGAAGPSSGAMAGSNGNNSQFASLTVGLGGGGGAAGFGGGGPSSQHNGKDGGSGGGATRNGTTGLTTQSGTGATAFHGNNGGSAGAVDGGAGGGGAGAAGNSAPLVVGGSGGNGINIYSSLVLATGLGVGGFIAGGGGGGAYSGAGGTGGLGGGGTGGAGGGGQGNAGTANSGGGAGGTGGNAPAHAGNAGGSGLVIVRYAV